MGRMVFSVACYEDLAEALCQKFPDLLLGTVQRESYPDGERSFRLLSQVADQDVILIGSTLPQGHFNEFMDLASGLAAYGARSLTFIIPYFAYSTMERATQPGDIVTAKNRARMISALPQGNISNRLILMDLHSSGLPHYFEGSLRTLHLSAKSILLAQAKQLWGKNFVLASTDAGRAKWVEAWARELAVEPAFILKRRMSGHETKVLASSDSLEGRKVLIYDDMIRTGGSLLEAARVYQKAGAIEISAMTTHGIFANQALQRLKESGLFKKIICTNSFPHVERYQDDFLKVISIVDILGEALPACL